MTTPYTLARLCETYGAPLRLVERLDHGRAVGVFSGMHALLVDGPREIQTLTDSTDAAYDVTHELAHHIAGIENELATLLVQRALAEYLEPVLKRRVLRSFDHDRAPGVSIGSPAREAGR